MPRQFGKQMVRTVEYISYFAGAVLSVFFVVQLAQGEVDRQGDIEQFQQLASLDFSDSAAQVVETGISDEVGQPDMTLWAPGRIADYEASLKAELPPVLGVLQVDSVGLKVPVYSTDTDLTMDRGAGVIDGMAYPHELGNIGIAGHRDGYFRVLKDVKVGDKIELQTLKGPKQFTINNVQIVEISDTHLLQDTEEQTVTLVTCYPFYFVGHAPQRFIVTASLDTTNVVQQ
jgi:LPXTG-site transpeptidase (sortase) family protein